MVILQHMTRPHEQELYGEIYMFEEVFHSVFHSAIHPTFEELFWEEASQRIYCGGLIDNVGMINKLFHTNIAALYLCVHRCSMSCYQCWVQVDNLDEF